MLAKIRLLFEIWELTRRLERLTPYWEQHPEDELIDKQAHYMAEYLLILVERLDNWGNQ